MALNNCNQNLTETQESQQQIGFILLDGVHEYDHPEDKFVVVVDGQEIAWASTQERAWRIYHDELHHQRVHFERFPEDYDIPVYANGQLAMVINMADEYGLEAKG